MITDESNPGVDKCEARNYESPLHQREREGEREREREREGEREREREIKREREGEREICLSLSCVYLRGAGE